MNRGAGWSRSPQLREKQMLLYTAKIRLGGSLYNEVPREDLTAAEILVLQALHGNDGVVDIKSTGKVAMAIDFDDDLVRPIETNRPRTDEEERQRLRQLYASSILTPGRTRLIEDTIGARGPVPHLVPGVEAMVEAPAEEIRVRRGRPPAAKATADDLLAAE